MGAVVAIKSSDRIYIAADRMKKRLEFYWRTNAEFNFKIHKLKNGVTVGAIGPLAEVQKLYLNESWFNPPKDTPFDKKFIVTSIIPRYIDYLKEFNLLEDSDDDDTDYPHTSSSFIIAKDKDMFLIDSNFGVFIMNDIAIISDENQDSALEALALLLDKTDPEKFLVEIFAKAAANLGNMVPEIVLTDTVNTEFRFLGGTK